MGFNCASGQQCGVGHVVYLVRFSFPIRSVKIQRACSHERLFDIEIWKDNQEGWRTGFKEKVARMGAMEAGKGWICSLVSHAIYFRLYLRTMGSHRSWERERSVMD